MGGFVYILTNDPKERCELVSGVLSQAITALSFGHGCELFLMDSGVNLAVKDYLSELSCGGFAPLPALLKDYSAMGGSLYVCEPSVESRSLSVDRFISSVTGFVNASRLITSSKDALAVFTY
ncbi:MAG: hypothetical protein OHK006_23450 [Thermodesulfovibrionales bacterium]